jgi:flagellin
MSVAIRNANDAISFAQTADGGLASMNSSLQRMRELAVQASNGTYTSTDRTSLQSEFSQLQKEVTRVSSATKFNGISVLASTSDVTFQVGADNTSTTDQISISAVTASTDASITAATGTGTAISSQSAAQSAITAIDSAISQVNTFRANVGASQNRFESVIQNLQVFNQNQSAAKSRIVDADFSEETTKMTRNQILMQAGTAMLAQANQLPQSVLKLLQ